MPNPKKTLKIGSNVSEAIKYWQDLLKKEFLKETDRGAVILTTSLLDVGLDTLLHQYLIPVTSSEDELFDGNNAPLGSFNSKINLSFRLGLISDKFARDLHIIRKMRNEFAHNIHGCDFEHSSVKKRVIELVKSFALSKVIQGSSKNFYEKTTRGDFLMVSTWLLHSLNNKIEKTKSIIPCEVEFGYMHDLIEGLMEEISKKIT